MRGSAAWPTRYADPSPAIEPARSYGPHRLAEMIADSKASPDDSELLVRAAVEAGIRGGERYARGQVQHVLGAAP